MDTSVHAFWIYTLPAHLGAPRSPPLRSAQRWMPPPPLAFYQQSRAKVVSPPPPRPPGGARSMRRGRRWPSPQSAAPPFKSLPSLEAAPPLYAPTLTNPPARRGRRWPPPPQAGGHQNLQLAHLASLRPEVFGLRHVAHLMPGLKDLAGDRALHPHKHLHGRRRPRTSPASPPLESLSGGVWSPPRRPPGSGPRRPGKRSCPPTPQRSPRETAATNTASRPTPRFPVGRSCTPAASSTWSRAPSS